MKTANPWLYDKPTDLMVFGLSTLSAILLGLLFPSIDFVTSMMVYVFIDIGHSFATQFFTLTSNRIVKEHRRFFISVPIFIFITAFALGIFELHYIAMIFPALSLLHFMKQQQAWVFIAARKNGARNKWEKLSDISIIYAAVWVPEIISLTFEQPLGWFRTGDVGSLPLPFKDAAIAFAMIALIFYLIIEVKRWIDLKIIHWSKHFHLLNAAFIWYAARVFFRHDHSMGALLIMFGHSMPYKFLFFRYLKQRKEKKEYFWPGTDNYIFYGILILGVSYALTYVQYIRVKDTSLISVIGAALSAMVAISHYAFDSYLWRSSTHPEGTAVFFPEKTVEKD